MGVVPWVGDGGRLNKNISRISFYTGFENSTIVQDTDKMILRLDIFSIYKTMKVQGKTLTESSSQ